MDSHHTQYCPSTQVRVAEPGYAIIWYSEGGWSGVVPLSYPKNRVMVDLHPTCTYIKSVQLRECAHITLNVINPPKLWSFQLGMQTSGTSRVVVVVWCRCHTPRPRSNNTSQATIYGVDAFSRILLVLLFWVYTAMSCYKLITVNP